MKKIKKADFLSLGTVVIALAGGILVACHLQLIGLIVAACGLLSSIVCFCLKKKLGLNIYVAYWSMIACIALVFLSAMGFAGYTVWDIYKTHDVN